MRIEHGDYHSHATDGTLLRTAEPLSREQADLVLQIIERAGQYPDTTTAVEIEEGRVVVEWLWFGGYGPPTKHWTVIS